MTYLHHYRYGGHCHQNKRRPRTCWRVRPGQQCFCSIRWLDLDGGKPSSLTFLGCEVISAITSHHPGVHHVILYRIWLSFSINVAPVIRWLSIYSRLAVQRSRCPLCILGRRLFRRCFRLQGTSILLIRRGERKIPMHQVWEWATRPAPIIITRQVIPCTPSPSPRPPSALAHSVSFFFKKILFYYYFLNYC